MILPVLAEARPADSPGHAGQPRRRYADCLRFGRPHVFDRYRHTASFCGVRHAGILVGEAKV